MYLDVSRFGGAVFFLNLSFLTGPGKVIDSVSSTFPCCKDGSDNFQELYTVRVKLKVPK